MVYIRSKSVKGDKYLYLVRSVWNSKKSTSRQEIIKYLGKAAKVRLEDIPSDYRDDPKIAAFLSSNAGGGIRRTERLVRQARDRLFDAMTRGDLDGSMGVCRAYARHAGMDDFYEAVLRPAMYRIGDMWAANKLGIAAEHVSSNIAKEMLGIISASGRRGGGKAKVLLCTPSGEEHVIGIHVIQSYLQSKGYMVFNLAPSAPAESVLSFIESERPDVVLVSVTIEDSVRAGQRLVRKIRSSHDIPVLVGGQAVADGRFGFGDSTVSNVSLGAIPKLIRDIMR